MELPIETLYPAAWEYMKVLCGLEGGRALAEQSGQRALQVRDQCFAGMLLHCMLFPFGTDCVRGEAFHIQDTVIPCGALGQIDKSSIQGGWAFLLRSPMPDIHQLPVSQMYFADAWETCFVDSGRDRLGELLLEDAKNGASGPLYITDTFAPGMAGMPSGAVREFFHFLDGERIGVRLRDSGMMDPVKSFVGIFLLLSKKQGEETGNCAECVAGRKSCIYCREYARRYGKGQGNFGITDGTVRQRG